MSEAQKIGRQHGKGEKRPVMVYVPEDLRQYLEERKMETGLSMSAYIVVMIRRESRSGS